MRYTEEHSEISEGSLVSRIVYLIFLAPHRLLSEISKKLPFLGKEVIERVVMLSIFFGVGLLVVNALIGLVAGSLTLNGGIIPMSALMLFILVSSTLYLVTHMDLKLNVSLSMGGSKHGEVPDVEEVEETVEEEEVVEIVEGLEEDSEGSGEFEKESEEIFSVNLPQEPELNPIEEEPLALSVPVTSTFLESLKPEEIEDTTHPDLEEDLQQPEEIEPEIHIEQEEPLVVIEIPEEEGPAVVEETIEDVRLDYKLFADSRSDSDLLEDSKSAERHSDRGLSSVVTKGAPISKELNEQLKGLIGGF